MPGACWLMSELQLTRPKDTPVGYGICSTLGASTGGNLHQIQGDKRNTKIHHFLTITDCIAWPIAFCLHIDGEGGEGERGCVSLLGVLIQQRKCQCSVALDCITHSVKHAFLIHIRIT
jgi:hypothetical protein